MLNASINITVFGVLLICLCGCPAFSQNDTSAISGNTVSPLASANNAFGFDLLKSLNSSSTGDRNVFISPVSISQALGLLYTGSAGKTQDEIGVALHISGLKKSEFGPDNADLLAKLKSPDGSVNLSIANAIWSQTGKPFGNDYREEAADDFSAASKTVDFTQSGVAANAINKWVNTNTNGKIPVLVSPASVRNASMVLTNAVYFKGVWTDPFDPASTKPAPFTLAGGEQIQIPTMYRSGTVSSYLNQDVTVLKLDYNGTPSTSMIIVLPSSTSSINDITKTINPGELNNWIGQLIPRGIELYLPKFHVDYTQELTSALEGLGIKTAFTREADLSATGIADSYVSGVIHKSTLDVDEQGTVAAAATGVIMRSLARPIPHVVRVDHPFLCAIRDNDTGSLLFIGVINHPEATKAD